MRLDGKRAIVTGAASGIGASTARLLGSKGARVLVADIDIVGGRAVADEVVTAGGIAEFVKLDVTDEEEWIGAMTVVEQLWGGLDVLVNNAGISMFALVTELTLKQWRTCLAVDLDGVFLGTKHAVPVMRRSGGGSIVNMSSMAGITGFPNLSAYSAAKGGVRLFTKAIALECAGDMIRVNSVHPGLIKTPIFDNVSSDAAVGIGTVGAGSTINLDQLAARITPLGRPGSPEDVANAVAYLASDAAAYVTGTELIVDGGITAG